jgi:hypothetical protein
MPVPPIARLRVAAEPQVVEAVIVRNLDLTVDPPLRQGMQGLFSHADISYSGRGDRRQFARCPVYASPRTRRWRTPCKRHCCSRRTNDAPRTHDAGAIIRVVPRFPRVERKRIYFSMLNLGYTEFDALSLQLQKLWRSAQCCFNQGTQGAVCWSARIMGRSCQAREEGGYG